MKQYNCSVLTAAVMVFFWAANVSAQSGSGKPETEKSRKANHKVVVSTLQQYSKNPKFCASFFTGDKILRFLGYFAVKEEPSAKSLTRFYDLLSEPVACQATLQRSSEPCSQLKSVSQTQSADAITPMQRCADTYYAAAFFRALFITGEDPQQACIYKYGNMPGKRRPRAGQPPKICSMLIKGIQSGDAGVCSQAASISEGSKMVGRCRQIIKASVSGNAQDCPATKQGRISPDCALMTKIKRSAKTGKCDSWDCKMPLVPQNCSEAAESVGAEFCRTLPKISESPRFDDALLKALQVR